MIFGRVIEGIVGIIVIVIIAIVLGITWGYWFPASENLGNITSTYNNTSPLQHSFLNYTGIALGIGLIAAVGIPFALILIDKYRGRGGGFVGGNKYYSYKK